MSEILLAFFSTKVSSRVCVCFSTTMMMMTMMMMMRTTTTTLACVVLRLRIANQMVMDSRCREGIVHSRGGCSRARSVWRPRPTALWRFRASTSNSLSDRFGPHTDTHSRHIHHTHAQQGIRVCGGDHFEPPNRQYSNPKEL